MPGIVALEADHYRIPLESNLTDSMHGEMLAFELNTVRLRDADGAEGVGYTYTCGRNGAAIHSILTRDLPDQLIGQEADRIEHLWQKIWWGQHYGGRGGAAVLAQSAVDMALWDLKARRLGQPLWTLLGGHDPRVPCYAGGIDLDLPLDRLLRQTDDNLRKGPWCRNRPLVA
jgi:L-alanine-DL-glutamate epimerase-like enolase superfamily enzyme